MSPGSDGGVRSTTSADAIASARTCSMVAAIVAGSGPVTRAAICSINCGSAHSAYLVSTARSTSLIDGHTTGDGACGFPSTTVSISSTSTSPSARARHRSRSVAVGNPASAGFAVRVARVIVLWALPTSTGDGGRPSRSTNAVAQAATSVSMSTPRVENSTNTDSSMPMMSA